MARHDILLIGDGTKLLKTIGWVLDYKGFAVKVTASPEAALEALVKKNYDLVIGKLTTDDREVPGHPGAGPAAQPRGQGHGNQRQRRGQLSPVSL